MVKYKMIDGKVPSGEEMIEVYGSYDVVVVGGGMAGCGAGIAAARAGAKTLLIETTSALGGLATMGLVNIPLDYRCGIGDEMISELEKIDGHWHRNSDPEKHKLVLDRMMAKYGCEVLLVTQVVDAIVDGNDVKGLFIQTKRGRMAVFAKRFVDSSGDSDLVYYAGGECKCGRSLDGYSMGTSLEFVLGGVDWDSYVSSDLKREDQQWIKTIQKALAAGDLPYEIDNHLNWMTHIPGRPQHCGKDEVSICIAHSRRAIPTDNRDLSRMYVEGREQAPILLEFIKKYIPGFSGAYLIYTGALLGVRESRRIVGEYKITGEDLAYGRHFDDVISISSHGYDFHGYLEAGNPKWIRMKLEEDGREAYVSNVGGWGSQFPPDDDLPRLNMRDLIKDEVYYYDIPYRAMLPIRLENVIAAGRNLSSNAAGQSGCRLVLLCCNLGEAAGTAAAKSIKENIRLRDVNVPELQRELVANGMEIGQKYRKIPSLGN